MGFLIIKPFLTSFLMFWPAMQNHHNPLSVTMTCLDHFFMCNSRYNEMHKHKDVRAPTLFLCTLILILGQGEKAVTEARQEWQWLLSNLIVFPVSVIAHTFCATVYKTLTPHPPFGLFSCQLFFTSLTFCCHILLSQPKCVLQCK